jgi:hypothetical protein
VIVDYVGAGARLAPARAIDLDPRRWAWMPKRDGVYARATLDGRGRIARVLSRAGAELAEAADLIGLVAGEPDSVLHGELEAHTEAGNRAAAARGWRALHLFDVTRTAGRDVTAIPFEERYGLLHQAQARLEQAGAGRVAGWTVDAAGDAHDRRGRYCRQVPRDLRRFPIVPLHRGRGAAAALWRDHVELAGGEGIVAVQLGAPARARGGKRKVKLTESLESRVVEAGAGLLRVVYGSVAFTVGGTAPIGAIVTVLHDGWYERGATPRFPRLERLRRDLA